MSEYSKNSIQRYLWITYQQRWSQRSKTEKQNPDRDFTFINVNPNQQGKGDSGKEKLPIGKYMEDNLKGTTLE